MHPHAAPVQPGRRRERRAPGKGRRELVMVQRSASRDTAGRVGFIPPEEGDTHPAGGCSAPRGGSSPSPFAVFPPRGRLSPPVVAVRRPRRLLYQSPGGVSRRAGAMHPPKGAMSPPEAVVVHSGRFLFHPGPFVFAPAGGASIGSRGASQRLSAAFAGWRGAFDPVLAASVHSVVAPSRQDERLPPWGASCPPGSF